MDADIPAGAAALEAYILEARAMRHRLKSRAARRTPAGTSRIRRRAARPARRDERPVIDVGEVRRALAELRAERQRCSPEQAEVLARVARMMAAPPPSDARTPGGVKLGERSSHASGAEPPRGRQPVQEPFYGFIRETDILPDGVDRQKRTPLAPSVYRSGVRPAKHVEHVITFDEPSDRGGHVERLRAIIRKIEEASPPAEPETPHAWPPEGAS